MGFSQRMEGGMAAALSWQKSLFGCMRVESSYEYCYGLQNVALQVGSSAPRPRFPPHFTPLMFHSVFETAGCGIDGAASANLRVLLKAGGAASGRLRLADGQRHHEASHAGHNHADTY